MSESKSKASPNSNVFRFNDELTGEISIDLEIPVRIGRGHGTRIVTHVFEMPSADKLVECYRQAQFQIAGGELEQEEESAQIIVWREFIKRVEGYEDVVAADLDIFRKNPQARRHAKAAANCLIDHAMIKEAQTTRPLSL